MIKLNLGSNSKIIGDDWVNVDGLDLPNVDFICDLNNIPFILESNINKFDKYIDLFNNGIEQSYIDIDNPNNSIFNKKGNIKDDSVDKISMTEVLEHISFRNTEKVLKELYRIIKPDCRIHIQVPDCGRMMEYYVNNEICDCVNHKETKDGFNADPNCFNCQGKAKINTKRWLYSFTGAQKHNFDSHLMVFTKNNLRDILLKVGFRKVEFEDHIYKLKVNVYK